MMPSIGLGRSLVHQVGLVGMESNGEGRCDCCPYGYHIDLDFVPFSKKMLSGESDYERLKELKDKWRSERQSMDKLLGVRSTIPKTWDGNLTISRATTDVWERRTKELKWGEPTTTVEKRRGSSVPRSIGIDLSIGDSSELLQNGLGEAVTDFEEALRRTRPQSKILSYEIPDSQKFHTFPRIKGTVLKDPVTGASSSLTASSIFSNRGSSSATSASTVVMRDVIRASPKRSEDSLTDVEEKAGRIPELQSKLSALAEEKKQLLQLLEAERAKYASLKRKLAISKATEGKSVSTRDASVQKSVITRDVGVTHIGPRTRTIAVGDNFWDRNGRGDSVSPTGSTTSTLRRRVKTFEAGIQVKEYELPGNEDRHIPLQIQEGKDFGVQVGPGIGEEEKKEVKPAPRRKHASVMAKPTMSDVGISFKPSVRDAGSLTTPEKETPKPVKPRTKHVGISVSLDAAEKPSAKEIRKPVRTFATNTERLRNMDVGCNTEIERVTSSSSQTDLVEISKEREEPERERPSTATNIHKRPTSVTSSQQLSKTPGESKVPSKIPRLASPSSPGLTRASSLGRLERSESPASLPSSGRQSPVDIPPPVPVPHPTPPFRKPAFMRQDTYTKDVFLDRQMFGTLEPLEEEEREPRSSSASSSSGFAPPPERREKVSPSKEMQAALKVLNDALLRGRTTQNVTNAISIILHEWFRIAGTKTANPYDVEDYLDSFEIYSPQLLRYIVNMPDGNGNTALHYAVSHGNFDVVSVLLDSRVCDPNKANKAGYTSIMLVALANITCDSHRQVVRRLFSLGDVNLKAAQHGQTALMLGASHGRLDTVRLLVESGADINIQDEDGSTALMCAAEHGHTKIVKYLISHPDSDLHLTDNDGSTAFSIAMEGGHKDIGVLLYAQMHFGSSTDINKSISTTPSAGSHNSSASSSAQTSPTSAKRQQHSPLNVSKTMPNK